MSGRSAAVKADEVGSSLQVCDFTGEKPPSTDLPTSTTQNFPSGFPLCAPAAVAASVEIPVMNRAEAIIAGGRRARAAPWRAFMGIATPTILFLITKPHFSHRSGTVGPYRGRHSLAPAVSGRWHYRMRRPVDPSHQDGPVGL